MKNLFKLLFSSRFTASDKAPCPACGARLPMLQMRVISDLLADAWDLNREWTDAFNEREGKFCLGCLNSRRSLFLAETLLNHYNSKFEKSHPTLASLVRDQEFQNLQIAEINSCGNLHKFLSRVPNLKYSEFNSKNSRIAHQDILNLSYPDASFDLVLTSETLEHVPDVVLASKEIFRILKPGGVHIFTIPLVLDGRSTRQRAFLSNASIIHQLPPSFHGLDASSGTGDLLVFYEFGADVSNTFMECGFDAKLFQDVTNPALTAIVARKITN
jgi:SAM-dependent methyltransferase